MNAHLPSEVTAAQLEELKVKYKSATVDQFIEQFGTDVSRGGIFIKTKKPIEIGALLKLELQLNDASPVIHGIGRVCWRRENSAKAAPNSALPKSGHKVSVKCSSA